MALSDWTRAHLSSRPMPRRPARRQVNSSDQAATQRRIIGPQAPSALFDALLARAALLYGSAFGRSRTSRALLRGFLGGLRSLLRGRLLLFGLRLTALGAASLSSGFGAAFFAAFFADRPAATAAALVGAVGDQADGLVERQDSGSIVLRDRGVDLAPLHIVAVAAVVQRDRLACRPDACRPACRARRPRPRPLLSCASRSTARLRPMVSTSSSLGIDLYLPSCCR